jgi:signal transduction histidine kinase
MEPRPLLQRRRVRWALIFGVLTVCGLIDASQSYVLVLLLDRPIRLEDLVALGLAEWYCWAPLVALLLLVGWRFPFEQRNWGRRLAILLAASAGFAALKVALDLPIELLLRVNYTPTIKSRTPWEFFQILFMARFFIYLLVCWTVLGIGHALDYYRRYREHELQATGLEAQLARAQLQVLKMQLQPHFLFNTLNAISALVHKDVHLADRMIARLGDLLRLTLDNAGTQEVPLQQELDFVKLYLEIERARLGPRLSLHFEIDPEARGACVPNLILQPIVENAVRHGIAPFSRPGRIEIEARRVEGRLWLEVRDDGPGLNGTGFKEGVGLANTRARLQQLYGAAHRFEMTNGPGRGFAVTLTLPLRDGPPDPAPAHAEREDEDPVPYRG